MTRPNPLVLDGNEVKLRLQAQRIQSQTPVHVDWVRFTCLLRNAITPSPEILFPASTSVWDEQNRDAEIQRHLKDLPDAEFAPSAQALELAQQCAQALGSDFIVNPEIKKGHDFYRFRWSIERHGSECGWVGFLSSGDSPRQQAQAQTIHANIYGIACTFAEPGWNQRIADIIDETQAKLTRADLALDFFDGFPGGIESIETDYKNGLCDSGGKRLKTSIAGDWFNGHERSIYLGSREAGKQTNAYEKGDQLFGRDAGSPWLRIELRYGNKLRVLPSDMLRRPADFFAGASDWHQAQLLKAQAIATPEPVKTEKRLALETVQAEVTRNIRWAMQTAAPTLAAAFQYLNESLFLEICTNQKLPGRLQKFGKAEVKKAFESVFSVDRTCPAFV